MKKPVSTWGAVVAVAGVAVGLGVAPNAAIGAEADEDYQILVVGETLGFRHSHIDDTTLALIKLGEENGFTVDVWDPPVGRSPGQPALSMTESPFTSTEDLSKYATIVFASPVDGTNSQNPASPRLLDDAELAAFQGYIRGGGGYLGLHAATDAMHAVPWYSELTGGGARFRSHPAQQQATMRVENPAHPSTTMLPAEWSRYDEWYNFTTNPREDVHVLITLDETTYNPGNGAMGADHPLAWCQNFEGGRSWYEGAGHVDSAWTDPIFLEHILGGLEWTAGLVSGGGDCVTFPEVGGVLAAATGDESVKAEVQGHLAAAKTASDADKNADAITALILAQRAAGSLENEALDAKIDDLLEWQRGLTTDGPSDADGVPIDVTIVDAPGALTLTVADVNDAVRLNQEEGFTDRWRFTAGLPTVKVSDSRNATQAGNSGWAASGQSSAFTSDDDTLGAENFGWAPKVVTPRDGVIAGPQVNTAIDGGTGLATASLLASATPEGRRGVTDVNAWLFLDAPLGTPEGDYSARLTLSLFPTD
ncbi:ThuA domain-containing protein [Microbacterium sp. P04]|uniref:ThuA domain-containing protein n=1 Tax=Microbacterium sp. P04 TaxID=3366947 RepID=UPI00374528CF